MLFLCFFFWVTDNGGGDDDVCGKVDCGQGKCVPSNTSFLGVKGFDCFCKPGWQKMELGPIILPACTIPNCEYPLFFPSARFFKEKKKIINLSWYQVFTKLAKGEGLNDCA